jgi:hypothetical protein
MAQWFVCGCATVRGFVTVDQRNQFVRNADLSGDPGRIAIAQRRTRRGRGPSITNETHDDFDPPAFEQAKRVLHDHGFGRAAWQLRIGDPFDPRSIRELDGFRFEQVGHAQKIPQAQPFLRPSGIFITYT